MAFAIPTVSDLQTLVWDTIVDTDTNNRAFDATTLLRIMNKLYAEMKGISDDRVWDLSPTQAGLSMSDTTTLPFVTLTPINIRRILQVFPSASALSSTPTGRPLSRVEPWEVMRMWFDEPEALNAITPALTHATVFAAWRAASTTPATVGKWNVGLWRRPITTSSTTSYYIVRALMEPELLSSGAITTPDLTAPGCYALADMTAAVGARLIGRSEEEIADIKARIPSEYGAILRGVETELALTGGKPAEQPA